MVFLRSLSEVFDCSIGTVYVKNHDTSTKILLDLQNKRMIAQADYPIEFNFADRNYPLRRVFGIPYTQGIYNANLFSFIDYHQGYLLGESRKIFVNSYWDFSTVTSRTRTEQEHEKFLTLRTRTEREQKTLKSRTLFFEQEKIFLKIIFKLIFASIHKIPLNSKK